jgi:hypothetical protein
MCSSIFGGASLGIAYQVEVCGLEVLSLTTTGAASLTIVFQTGVASTTNIPLATLTNWVSNTSPDCTMVTELIVYADNSPVLLSTSDSVLDGTIVLSGAGLDISNDMTISTTTLKTFFVMF